MVGHVFNHTVIYGIHAAVIPTDRLSETFVALADPTELAILARFVSGETLVSASQGHAANKHQGRRTEMEVYWIKAQAPRRVLALLKHLRVDAQLVEVDLMAGGLADPAYMTLNPNKKVPTLVDGNVVLWESSAIMAYLCIKYNSDMWPAQNPAEQIEVLRWLSWCDSHWSPTVSLFYFEHVVKATFGLGPPNRSEFEKRIPDLVRYAKVLDEHLDGRTRVACDRLTIADFQLASMATYWREAEMPLGSFHNIVRWIDDLMCLPAWSDPWPAGASTRS